MALCKDFNTGLQKGKHKKKTKSRFLRHLLICLKENRHSHMLKRREILEFEVTYKHMRDPTWKDQDISLFVEMDVLKKPQRQRDIHFSENTRNRFKANIRKLCKSGVLTAVDWDNNNTNKRKSIKKKRYRFLKMYDELHLPGHEAKVLEEKVLTESLFEREKEIPTVTDDSENDSSINKEMEIIMLIKSHQLPVSSNQEFNCDEEKNLSHETKKDHGNKDELMIYSDIRNLPLQEIKVVAHPLEEAEDSRDLDAIIQELVSAGNPQVVPYALGETEDSVDLVPYMEAYEHEDKSQVLQKYMSCNDPLMSSTCEAGDHSDAVSADSELESKGPPAFSFSQSDADITSLYG